jgi:EmrB/QacA subfamily drug resistance transporter
MTAVNRSSHKWWALALLCASQFMVVLDVAIVNVALPSIQKGLDFSQGNLQWVLSAYTLVFGGFLLLGGRTADLYGRRRVFMVGMLIFTVASLLCGLAQSEGWLISARAVQGLGAAIIAPAALSIVMTTFEEGAERNKALGVWGAIGGAGAAVGVLLGGILTSWLGWEWIFFINVPVGAAVLALSRTLLNESTAGLDHRQLDVAGAVTITSGLSILVYAVVTAHQHGWASATTIGLLVVSALLHTAFIAIERRSSAPLLPLSIFRLRTLTGANITGFLLGASIFAMFFFLSLYMQQILGWSALKTGVSYLAIALTTIPAAGIAQALVTRIGVRTVLAVGMGCNTAALLWFTQVSVGGNYVTDLLPGFLIGAVGLGFSFVPISIAALAGVQAQEAGLASGLINTSQQIGGAVGVAILSTIATTRTSDLISSGTAAPFALTSGFRAAFAVAAGLTLVGVIVTLLVIRTQDIVAAPAAEPALENA